MGKLLDCLQSVSLWFIYRYNTLLDTDELDRVGQEFWVYGIQGSSKLGIRYIYAEIWVLSIWFVLLTTNFGYDGTDLDVFGTNRNSQQETASTAVQLPYSDLDCPRSASDAPARASDRSFFGLQRPRGVERTFHCSLR